MSQPGFKLVEEGEDQWSILSPGLRLSFVRTGGRWIHRLAVGELLEPIVESVEGDPARDDPSRVVSPAYQEIQPHPVADGVCALLTGQSTPHHFSAVVTARGDGSSVLIEVDIADRCRAPIEVLAATYQVLLGSGSLRDADSGRIVWEGEALGGGQLEWSTRGGVTLALAEAGRRASRVQALARLVPSTYTHRLLYCWRWTPAGIVPGGVLD